MIFEDNKTDEVDAFKYLSDILNNERMMISSSSIVNKMILPC